VSLAPVQLALHLLAHQGAVFEEVLVEQAHPQHLIEQPGTMPQGVEQAVPEQPAARAAHPLPPDHGEQAGHGRRTVEVAEHPLDRGPASGLKAAEPAGVALHAR